MVLYWDKRRVQAGEYLLQKIKIRFISDTKVNTLRCSYRIANISTLEIIKGNYDSIESRQCVVFLSLGVCSVQPNLLVERDSRHHGVKTSVDQWSHYTVIMYIGWRLSMQPMRG